MKIIDLTAGNRAIWIDKQNPMAVYVDKRKSVNPDLVADSTKLPKNFKGKFDLVVFDPPHVNFGKNSNMSKCYGHLTTKQILNFIKGSGKEAHRVSKKNAIMALKWNDHDIKLNRVFDLMPNWEPLFGQVTKDGPGSKTYWVLLRRLK